MEYIFYEYGLRLNQYKKLGYLMVSEETQVTPEVDDMVIFINGIIDRAVTKCKTRSTNMSHGDVFKGKDGKLYQELTVWGNYRPEDVEKELATMPMILEHIKLMSVPAHHCYTHIMYEWFDDREMNILRTLYKLLNRNNKGE